MSSLRLLIILCLLRMEYFVFSNGVVADGHSVQLITEKQNFIQNKNTSLFRPVIKIVQQRQVTCPGPNSPLPCELGDSTSHTENGKSCPWEEKDHALSVPLFPNIQDNRNSPICYEAIDTEYSNETENTILGQFGDHLKFTCEAPHLTIWNTTIIPTKGSSYKESHRYDQDPFQLDELIFVNVFEIIMEGGTSGWIRCKSIGSLNEDPLAEVYIFAQNGPELVTAGYDAEGSVLLEDLNGNLTVPCVANYQHCNATLEQETELFQYEAVDPSRIIAPYDPRKGFIVRGTSAPEQTYRCVPSDNNVVLVYFKKIESHGVTNERKLTLFTGSLKDSNNETEKHLDVFCTSSGTTTQTMFLKMIRCTSPHECDWLSACFSKCWLNHDVEKQEVSATLAGGVLKNPYPTGLVVCILPGEGVQILDYYFIGLNRLSYFLNDPYPEYAVIRVETDEEYIYTFQSTVFKCTISTFLLVSNIRFAVTFKNKPPHLIDTINSDGDPLPLMEYENLGFAQREITVNLTKNMTSLVCMAPHYNSKEWINASIHFEPKDVGLPTIDQSASSLDRTFYHGKNNQFLHCSAKGDPKPEISWIFPSPEIEAKIKYTKSLEVESTLSFPKMDTSFGGKYMCIAKNRFGNQSAIFNVQVDDGSLGSASIVGLVIMGLALFALIVVFIYFLIQYNQTKDSIRNLTEEEINYFTHGSPDCAAVKPEQLVGPEVAKSMGFDKSYVIAERDLIIAKTSLLGQGEYGMVYRGFLCGEAVAVKTTKSNTDVTYVKALLGELKIMAYIGDHPHIVFFKGAVVSRIKERIVYAVVELSPVGNLHSYLRKIDEEFLYSPNGEGTNLNSVDPAILKNQKLPTAQGSSLSKRRVTSFERFSQVNCLSHVTTKNLIYWCKQIADGMDYLAQKKVIHGDLATRNILVFKHDVMKITDFGLSRQLYGYSQYVKKNQAPLPWRWLAVESLRFFEFSTESDVWSFGVTLWEIFSMGETPYPGMNWSMDFGEKLSNGLRMKKPKNTPRHIYDVMKLCWSTNPEDRPSFAVLKNYFDSFNNLDD